MNRYLILIILIFWSGFTLACSPLREDQNIEKTWYLIQDYNRADVVFRGRVVNTRLIEEKQKEHDLEWQYSSIDVYESYKGRVPLEVITKSVMTCCMCGQKLESGKEYLFYAKTEKDGSYVFSSHIPEILHSEDELELIEKINSGVMNPKLEKKRFYIKDNIPPTKVQKKASHKASSSQSRPS